MNANPKQSVPVFFLAISACIIACAVLLTKFHGATAQQKSDIRDPAAHTTPLANPLAEGTRADGRGDPLPAGAVARLGSIRLRPGGSVERMAFSPDGAKLAAWSGDSHTNDALSIWDTKTGAGLRRVDLPGARVDRLVWLADGRGIALIRSSYDDPVPFIWEFTDEKAEKPEVKPRKQGIISIVGGAPVKDNEHDSCYAVSPDGKTLAIGRAGALALDREVRLCELKTGVKVNALKSLKVLAKHPGSCGELYFTPDAKTLVVFGRAKDFGNGKFEAEQVVSVWDAGTGKSKAKFTAPRPATNGRRSAVALSDATLAIGLVDGDTSFSDLTTGKERKLATGHRKEKGKSYGTYSVAFSADGKTLATGGWDNLTKLWDVDSGKLLHTLSGHHSWVEALSFAPGGKLLASAGQDGMIRLWDPATGADACPLPGHKYIVGNVALSSDGKRAITGGWDNTVRWWDVDTGAEQRSIAVKEGMMGLTLSPDRKTVLVATDGGKLQMWDAATGRETTPENLPGDMKFQSFSFTPDGKHMVAASGPKVTIWEWPALKLIRTIELPKPAKAPPGEAFCDGAAVSPDGKWLVTVAHRYWYREADGLRYGYAAEGVADVWDFATGKRLRRLADSGTTFRTGNFTADGRFMLIGGAGTIPAPDGRQPEPFAGEMNLFDPVVGRHLRTFDVPAASEGAYRYSGASVLSPDGRTLFVSYNTGEIIGYEVATGKSRRTLTGRQGYIGGLVFSADGRRLISGGWNGTALVWDVTLAGAAKPRKDSPVPEKLWETGAAGEGLAAYVAMADFAASPDQAVEVLRRNMKPAPPSPTNADMDRIFKDLDSDDFNTRKKASQTLAAYGERAVPLVRKRLEANPSEEVSRRAVAFLKEFEQPIPSAMRVRQIRAVEVLEGIGTPDAKKLLSDLAAGGASAPLTLDAAAALKRLARP
jgi:WD40 repeat protein